MFAYLLPLQGKDQRLGFLTKVAAEISNERTRGDAVAALVECKAFDVLGKLIQESTGRRQGGLLYPLCQAAKTPEAKTFVVEQMSKKLTAKANPTELSINALPILGADAGPLLPLLKALNSKDKAVVDAIADIERKVAVEKK